MAASEGRLKKSLSLENTQGQLWNFWKMRNCINPDELTEKKDTRDFYCDASEVNLVRFIGGSIYHSTDYYEEKNGKVKYHFDRMYAHLDRILKLGLHPHIVLDKVPWDNARDIEDKERSAESKRYGVITPPKDYDKHYDYVRALVTACIKRYGRKRVATWRFRVGTEPDGRWHWLASQREYFKLYDYVSEAVLSVLPEAIVGVGNYCPNLSGDWMFKFFRHATTGKNFKTGRRGSVVRFVSFSLYLRMMRLHSMKGFFGRLKQTVDELNEMLAAYNDKHKTDVSQIDIAEHSILADPDGVRLWGGISNVYNGSYYAFLAMKTYALGISNIHQWYGARVYGVDTPVANVIGFLKQMVGCDFAQARPVKVVTDNVDALIAENRKKKTVYCFAVRHVLLMDGKHKSKKVVLELDGLPFEDGSVSVTKHVVDSRHGNFWPRWMAITKDWPVYGESPNRNIKVPAFYKNQRNDVAMLEVLNEAGEEVFLEHKKEFKELAKVVPERMAKLKVKEGKARLTLSMEPHSVVLLEIN